jgi:hypothetical protein
MEPACGPRWRNCALTTDAEMLSIDAMEDALAPLDAGVEAVRELISSLELCHHKAGRWVHNILEAIGAGGSTKGLGTRDPGPLHDAEQVWSAACGALSAWCSMPSAAISSLNRRSRPAAETSAGFPTVIGTRVFRASLGSSAPTRP